MIETQTISNRMSLSVTARGGQSVIVDGGENLPTGITILGAPGLLSTSPVAAFASLNPPIWLDASDASAHRVVEDGSGGVPDATDPVGVLLSKGSMGSQSASSFIAGLDHLAAIENPNFDDTSFWNIYNTSIANGKATLNGAAGQAYVYKPSVLNSGAMYETSFDVLTETVVGNGLSIRHGGIVVTGITGVGRHTYLRREIADRRFQIEVAGDSGWVGDIDTIFVKEIPGIHAFAPSSSERLTYETLGSTKVYRCDGTSGQAHLDISGLSGRSDLTICFCIKTSDSQGILFSSGISDFYSFCWEDGNTSAAQHFVAGTPEIWIDGSLFSGTSRDSLHTAIADAQLHSGVIRGLDLSHTNWDTLELFGYPGWRPEADIWALSIMPTADYDAARDTKVLPYLRHMRDLAA